MAWTDHLPSEIIASSMTAGARTLVESCGPGGACDQLAERLLSAELEGGPAHPDALAAANDLGAALFLRGEHADAAVHFARAWKGRTRVFGGGHSDVVASSVNLGLAKRAAGCRAEAARLFRSAADSLADSLGATHPRSREAELLYAEASAPRRDASVPASTASGAGLPPGPPEVAPGVCAPAGGVTGRENPSSSESACHEPSAGTAGRLRNGPRA